MSVTPGDITPSVIKLINVTFTGTTPVAVWTPTTGRRIVFQGCSLCARVTTALVGATVGAPIVIGENINNPLHVLGIIRTATDAPGAIDYGLVPLNMNLGYSFLAADAPLYASTYGSSTIGTGVIRIHGMVWGDEVGP